jgi:hypothetical protein
MISKKIIILKLSLYTIVLVMASLGCEKTQPDSKNTTQPQFKKESIVEINDNIFKEVQLNTNRQHACSPSPPRPNWKGVVIRAPKTVTVKRGEAVGTSGAFTTIPICGYSLVSASIKPEKPMRIVAVNNSTGIVYSGEIVNLDPSPEAPPPLDEEPLSEKEVIGIDVGKYFNPNLADFVKIPHETAQYNVHVEYRNYKSNVVTINVVEEKGN